MKYTVDRIEDNTATVELDDMTIVSLPLSALPSGVKEGDIISVTIDESETKNRQEKISSLMDDLFVD